jgi:hypothetical protein
VDEDRQFPIFFNSFSRNGVVCFSCENQHKILTQHQTREQWNKGRQLFFLTNHNMLAVLPSRNGKCPFIIKVEGELLREISQDFKKLLETHCVKEGSLILIGSITHLMEEGPVGYSKGLVTEFIRLSKMFKYTVHVVPFLPPPLSGTNDPELVRSMVDFTIYLEKVVKWDLSSYYDKLQCYIFDEGRTASRKDRTQRGTKCQRRLRPTTMSSLCAIPGMSCSSHFPPWTQSWRGTSCGEVYPTPSRLQIFPL